MTNTLCIASQKGGVGKTTVSLNLAVAMAERGSRVLLVDLDPQGGIGHSLARGDGVLVGLADLLMGEATPKEALLQTKVPTLSILPRGRLDAVDACEFEQGVFGPGVLQGALSQVSADFQTVILDTPSGLGLVTRAALRVADFVLVPFETGALALRSVVQILRTVEHVRESENQRLTLLGILPTMVGKTDATSLSVLSEIWNGFPVLETIIPRVATFAEAALKGVPVSFLAGPVSPEARRFDLLAAEVEHLMARLSGEESRGARPQRELL